MNENIGSQAKVVFDKFHVVATASKAVDETRRAEARQSASAHNVLKESRWVWRKNPENLTDKQKIKFRSLEKENLATARAYQMRFNLIEIYKIPNKLLAGKRIMAWCRWVRHVSKSIPD